MQIFGDSTEQTLVACIADGAGSARFSQVGSSIACETIVERAKAHFDAQTRLDNLDRDGVIVKRVIGAHDWSAPVNRQLVERLLATRR